MSELVFHCKILIINGIYFMNKVNSCLSARSSILASLGIMAKEGGVQEESHSYCDKAFEFFELHSNY